jgi:hypothetical protein
MQVTTLPVTGSGSQAGATNTLASAAVATGAAAVLASKVLRKGGKPAYAPAADRADDI